MAVSDSPYGLRLLDGLKIPDNEINIAEKKLSSNAYTFRGPYLKRSASGNRKRANQLAPSSTLIGLYSDQSFRYSKRLPALVAQPVTITLPLVSKI
jgi:hypothetical protein